jgi:Trk K+ transport system NAD-binding subunit
VIGLSRIGRQVAFNLAKEGRKVVVIADDNSGPDSHFIKENGGVVLVSKDFDEIILKQAGLGSASFLFIATDDDDTNLKLTHFVSRLKKRKYVNGSLKIYWRIILMFPQIRLIYKLSI